MATYLVNQNRVISLGNLGEVDRPRVKDFMNIIQDDVVTRERWSWTERATNVATVAGTQTVAVPAGVNNFGRLRPVSPVQLKEPRFRDWNSFEYNYYNRKAVTQTGSGMPTEYSLYNGNIVFDTIPDQVYTYSLQYWGLATALSADGDITIIPEAHDDVLVYGTLMMLCARDKNPEMMSYWQNMYEGKIKSMLSDERMNQYETIKKIAMPRDYFGAFDV
jgi:hypothetical protein